MVREIDRAEATVRVAAGAALLDAQGPGKFEHQHIAGAIHGRLDDPEAVVARIGDDLDQEIIVYCTDGACSGSLLAARLLEGRGYRNVLRFTAGLADWVATGLPVETDPA